MLERFLRTFPPAGAIAPISQPTLAALQDGLGGAVFGGGLLRVHTVGSARAADASVAAGSAEFAGRIQCFAFDWLGRQFSLDPTRGERNDPGVLMFEPGTAEALEVPATFSTFFDDELVGYADAALASGFFSQWLEFGGNVPAFNECVGYRTPLLLGGEDTISNLEIIEMDVYLHLMAELRRTVGELPTGSGIGGVDID